MKAPSPSKRVMAQDIEPVHTPQAPFRLRGTIVVEGRLASLSEVVA
jgi:hypothetical protein